jgi:NADPH-dependent 2,4-dienoyl-CoA reductase/sulfur reductase-like enzyme
MLADPDLPRKARAGKADEIRPCIRCFECFAGITTKRQNRCAVNPEIGFEQDVRHALPATRRKRVLMAGGGVAGMQAALTAAERGHEVILCEKAGRLGGVLRCEQKVPFKRLLELYLDSQARAVRRAPIDLRLATAVTPELAAAVEADVIIAALGGRQCVPQIPGIDGANVLGAEEAYRSPDKVGAAAVILGGGLAGIELAIFLAGLGRTVTILEMMEALSDGGNPVHGLALATEIKRYGIGVVTSTLAVDIDERGVTGEYVGGAYTLPAIPAVQAAVLNSSSFSRSMRGGAELGSRTHFPADTVIYATGRQSLQAEADTLRFCAPEFQQIGDCFRARNVLEATRMGFAVARDL